MCLITDLIRSCIECEAWKIHHTHPTMEVDDLISVGSLMVYKKGKKNQCKAYYHRIARSTMLRYIQKELLAGGTVDTHGGDRKSKLYYGSPITQNFSIGGLPHELSDRPLPFGKPTPRIRDVESTKQQNPWYENDVLILKWYRKGEI